MSRETTDRNDPGLGYGTNEEPVPQNDAYLVLSEEERAKGFKRPLRHSYKHLACGKITSMSQGIAETYARDPKFYGATYCTTCYKHLPVYEFTWLDGTVVGS